MGPLSPHSNLWGLQVLFVFGSMIVQTFSVECYKCRVENMDACSEIRPHQIISCPKTTSYCIYLNTQFAIGSDSNGSGTVKRDCGFPDGSPITRMYLNGTLNFANSDPNNLSEAFYFTEMETCFTNACNSKTPDRGN